ncbi:MAG: hypothetical protein OEV66_01975 [Spirochaetia bacterium]|nr:hypothetical protein [Spirochaetia bacterium]
MKKILILVIGITALANCKTVDKSIVGGRQTIVVNRGIIMPGYPNASPTIAPFNTVFSSDIEDCLQDLRAEGVTQVTHVEGTSSTSADRSLFPLSLNYSTSPMEYCQAVGNR